MAQEQEFRVEPARCGRVCRWCACTAELRAAAVTTLADLAARAGTADIGLYFVTSGRAVDLVLGDGETKGLFDIHHSVESADHTLTMC